MKRLKLCRIEGHTFVGSLISKDSTVLDLGANRGAFSLEIKRRFGCAVHAVEPTPELAGELRNREHVTVYEAAVSASGRDLLFKIDRQNSEASSLVTEPGEGVIAVPGITLDRLLKKIRKVDLIKIDVEDSEIGILMTVPEELIKNVGQVTVEFHDFKKGSDFTPELFGQVCDRMRKLGFATMVMSYWTKGDVLFLNRKHLAWEALDKFALEIRGRWIPGIARTAKRLFNSRSRTSC